MRPRDDGAHDLPPCAGGSNAPAASGCAPPRPRRAGRATGELGPSHLDVTLGRPSSADDADEVGRDVEVVPLAEHVDGAGARDGRASPTRGPRGSCAVTT